MGKSQTHNKVARQRIRKFKRDIKPPLETRPISYESDIDDDEIANSKSNEGISALLIKSTTSVPPRYSMTQNIRNLVISNITAMVNASNEEELKDITPDMSTSMSAALAANKNAADTNIGAPAALEIPILNNTELEE
ncbi:hypothetical protein H112_05614 [Trichophyton rubrum D6]|uniref:Uncharacterized protein n=1 Tax=Trichophyton rubrum CBS 288.86 TaxID=1215330 RepID=A0A022VYB5_TRIRU|nr:hypothetical protein H100_05633 [Trichophyton rubrum MR850]EZF40291.1 hypothetical protein H102_05600 [Trichophyton rubrum CBS 100081]EZF51036.1 hypothetical protein H103_05623 [Trichophyton rubrum CBS 288.86]EZF61515.1 hypothetical protein H104_05613 [Trichophyton rubrum CBS 289.86]EZF82936.1 hypothetical protein H110_05622 [Trichophyton rubrum MR1448]EZG04554.1 hypothetical protein H106_05462 [Trichophyton rubrum CBS 735.88]EZG15099.1 hypothetical protein H107_05763 [Trichophyton rubrum 